MDSPEPSLVYAGVSWRQADGQRNFPASFTVLPAVGDKILAQSEGRDIALRVEERRFTITNEMEPASIWLACAEVTEG